MIIIIKTIIIYKKVIGSQQNLYKAGGLKDKLVKKVSEHFYKQLLLQRATHGTA